MIIVLVTTKEKSLRVYFTPRELDVSNWAIVLEFIKGHDPRLKVKIIESHTLDLGLAHVSGLQIVI